MKYCTERIIKPAEDGIAERVKKFREASEICKKETEGYPKWTKLMKRLECMSRELRKRGLLKEKGD